MDGLKDFDLGEPIICAEYDLEAALELENQARMAREASDICDDDEDLDVEEAAVATPPLPAQAVRPAVPDTAPPALTGTAQKKDKKKEKKDKKRQRERAKRRAAVVASLSSLEPPLPTSRVLQKAADSVPIDTPFSADGFRATKQRWTGLATPLPHPLLAHADDPEFLKRHMRYVDWKGDKCHLILDRKGHIIGILVPPPVSPDQWAPVVEAATAAMRAARDKMSFPARACNHRRGNFPTEKAGFAFGGGRQTVGNIKQASKGNQTAMGELLADDSIKRFATYPVPVFQAACFHIFSDYHQTKQVLLQKNPHLHRTFARSPFTAVTANLGPISVSPPHTDGGNKADGMCLIGALGAFDADKGGHLVCWDFDLIIRFPPGCSALIPSAVVTHSNTPIQEDEERYSLIQYSAGSLFRWVANGHQSDLQWQASATLKDIAQREEDRKTRWKLALQKFTRWKDLRVKNFTGRARVEVWDEGDVADFSDLTESEEEPSPPKKKLRRA